MYMFRYQSIGRVVSLLFGVIISKARIKYLMIDLDEVVWNLFLSPVHVFLERRLMNNSGSNYKYKINQTFLHYS